MKKIIVCVDTNDGDYIEKISTINDDTLEKIKPILEAIKGFKPYKTKQKGNYEWTHSHNWPLGEYMPREDLGEKSPAELYPFLTEEQIDLFQDFCPYGEHGFHSVESISVLQIASEEKYL